MDRSTVSHYRILGKLGEGGMGIVYKAQDLRLDRLVALKFLPPDVSEHGPERARFLQEARAASAINHPNVCVIYDIDDRSASPFIAMEYVEGVTLRQRIEESESPLPLRTVLDYATQVAEALEQAHACGVVHRDIKSENVMVTPQGRIKVMDFGLAKLRGSARLTQTSTTVGTLSYMAPEQVAGKAVDARADLFSFGVVVYELLTGRLPFNGPGEAAVMYAIAHVAPEPVSKHRPELSSEWLHVLDRALEKDPEDRYQSARDMLIDLRRLQRGQVPVRAGGAEVVATPAPRKPPRVRRAVWALAAIVAVATATLFLVRARVAGPIRLSPALTIRPLELPQTQLADAGLSPDGNWIAYRAKDPAGTWDLYFANANGGEPRRITSDSMVGGWGGAEISPDGSQVVYGCYSRGQTQIRLVPALGGESVFLAIGAFPKWRPDGRRIGYIRTRGSTGLRVTRAPSVEFWTVAVDGRGPRQEFADSITARPEWYSFDWSPDGNSIAWVRTKRSGGDLLVAHRLDSGRERVILDEPYNIGDVAWTRRNEILIASDRGGSVNLWAIRAAGGPVVQVTRGNGPDIESRASADGRRVLYLQADVMARLWVSSLRTPHPQLLTPDFVKLDTPCISPDGRRVAVKAYDSSTAQLATGHMEIIGREGSRRRLPIAVTTWGGIAWSPDGGRLALAMWPSAMPSDSANVVLVDLSDGGVRSVTGGWRPQWIDDRHLLVDRNLRAYIVPVEGGKGEQLGIDSTSLRLRLGKDLVYYQDYRSGKKGGWVGDMRPDGLHGVAKHVSVPGEVFGLDVPERSLVVVKQDGELWMRPLLGGPDRRVPGLFPGLNRQSEVSVSADGSTIAWTESQTRSSLAIIDHLH